MCYIFNISTEALEVDNEISGAHSGAKTVNCQVSFSLVSGAKCKNDI